MAPRSDVRRAPQRARAWMAAVGVASLTMAASGALARADEAFRCELKEARGVSPADAGTAAGLICEELKRVSDGRGAFGVTLATLGRTVVVTTAREGTLDSVTVQVDGLEEVPVAAVRIAEALVRGQAFATTQRVDNLLRGETRPALAKKGSVKFFLGVADVESPGHGARAAGFSLGLVYASPRFALPAEMRFAWDDAQQQDPGLSLFSISVGGRGYLSKRDVSPFVGGGLGVLRLSASEGAYPGPDGSASGYFYGERWGVAPYVEAGVEMLRLHRGRVGLQIRADFPTAALRSEAIEGYSWDERTGTPRVEYVYPAQSRYVVPVTIGLSVAF